MRTWRAIGIGVGVAVAASAQTVPRGAGRVAVVVEGPYRDEAAFCEVMREDEARCHEPADEDGAPVCGCVEPGPDDGGPDGTLALASPRGPLRAARVARVVRDVNAYDACVLLLTTAQGTFAVAGFASCGMPRMPRDTTMQTRLLRIAEAATPGGGARVVAFGRELTSVPEMRGAGGPRGRWEARAFTLTVEVSAQGRVLSAHRVGAVRPAPWPTSHRTGMERVGQPPRGG